MSLINTFNPQIYPRLLWIQVGQNSHPEQFCLSEFSDNEYAVTESAFDKIEKKGGVFIRFENIEAMTTKNISHESTHAAMEIFDYIGAVPDLKNQEPFAYLVSWIAECCDEVKYKYVENSKY